MSAFSTVAWRQLRSSACAAAACALLAACGDSELVPTGPPEVASGPRLELTIDGARARSVVVPRARTPLRSLVGALAPGPWHAVHVRTRDGARHLRINPRKYRNHVITLSRRDGSALVEVVRRRDAGLARRADFAMANATRIDILTRPAKPRTPALTIDWAGKPRAVDAAGLARLAKLRWRQRSPAARADAWLLRDVLGAAGDRGAITRVTLTSPGGPRTITAVQLRRERIIIRRSGSRLQLKSAGPDGKTLWRLKDVARIRVDASR